MGQSNELQVAVASADPLLGAIVDVIDGIAASEAEHATAVEGAVIAGQSAAMVGELQASLAAQQGEIMASLEASGAGLPGFGMGDQAHPQADFGADGFGYE